MLLNSWTRAGNLQLLMLKALYVKGMLYCHRVIILNRGRMFAFQWREFSQPLSSAHRLLQCYHRQKRDRRRCNSRGIPPQPTDNSATSQWARSIEWRNAVKLHILVGKIFIIFFPFYCEGMLSLVVLWLCVYCILFHCLLLNFFL